MRGWWKCKYCGTYQKIKILPGEHKEECVKDPPETPFHKRTCWGYRFSDGGQMHEYWFE